MEGALSCNFGEAIQSGFSQLREFFGPRAALGILVLGAVRRPGHTSWLAILDRGDFSIATTSPCIGAIVGLAAVLLPGIAVVGAAPARHRSHRLVAADRAHRASASSC